MLGVDFYRRSDVVTIAKDLIGTWLFSQIEGEPVTGGMIIETEAYAGTQDRASHAYNGRRTRRNEMMYQAGGLAYVYLCYGIHPLLNVITHEAEIPHAILIRAIQPTEGLQTMQKRRAGRVPLADGPGMLTQALGITMQHNGQPLSSSSLWIEARQTLIADSAIESSPRIGIDYAGEDALLPWRFRYQLSKSTAICQLE